jgi:hypothetical protein
MAGRLDVLEMWTTNGRRAAYQYRQGKIEHHEERFLKLVVGAKSSTLSYRQQRLPDG